MAAWLHSLCFANDDGFHAGFAGHHSVQHSFTIAIMVHFFSMCFFTVLEAATACGEQSFTIPLPITPAHREVLKG